ncbi:MAG: methyl-accepting chemotaxis protein [Desulfovibrionales bacterium]|nr:methyl-accepting chemotaxis protein [Desulfovibrionales bacterium]
MKIGDIKILHRHLALMVLTGMLLGGVFFIGNQGLDNVSGELDTFAKWSEIDMVMNEDVTQNVLSLISSVRAYEAVSTEENYANVNARMTAANEGLANWLSVLSSQPELRQQALTISPQIATIKNTVGAYKKVQDDRVKIVAGTDAIIANTVAELERVMEELIDPAKERAEQSANIPEMVRWGAIDMVMNEAVIAYALKLQTAIHDYAYESGATKYQIVFDALTAARAGLSEWDKEVTGEQELKNTVQKIYSNYATIQKDLERLNDLHSKKLALDSKLDATADKISQTTNSIMEGSIDPAKEHALVEANAVKVSTTKQLLLVSLCSLALLFVVYIWLALFESKILGRLTAHAHDIAEGVFGRPLALNQKDEFGQICDALNQIEVSISNVLQEGDSVFSEVESGVFTATCDASQFNGAYAELIKRINNMLFFFEEILNRLPLGIMSRSASREVQYLNAFAKQILQAEKVDGQKCSDLFSTGDCAAHCAAESCMRSGNVESSETRAVPAGNEYEVAYSALPLISDAGKTLGAVTIIVDQTEARRTHDTMQSVANEADDISGRLAVASEELASQVEQVTQGSQLQKDRVGETAVAVEQMTETILEVAKNANAAVGHSDSAKSKAEDGEKLVMQVGSTIDQVNVSAQALQENMAELGQQADAIGSIMDVIMDIADQTNLLALNAAIEAARAGDAGRGFAVVADEVRSLAEKTMSATEDVGISIRAIQAASETSISSMDSAVTDIQRATVLAKESGDTLSQIVAMSTESSTAISLIATASEEQARTTESINKAVEDVNGVVAETADGMLESTKAVQGLAALASELKTLLYQLQTADQ